MAYAGRVPAGAVNRRIPELRPNLGSDGQHIGTVDYLEGSSDIKLTKSDPKSGGQHHLIPLAWVDHVDQHVHLNRSSQDVQQRWRTAA
jgi:hypothetical protein